MAEDGSALDYTERLRRLAFQRCTLWGDCVSGAGVVSEELDPKTLALVRLDVLVGVTPVVGLPRSVAAAPKLAMALGYDINDALEPPSGG
jgi:hypothetical protein